VAAQAKKQAFAGALDFQMATEENQNTLTDLEELYKNS